MAQKDSDLQKIEELIEIMKQNDLVEVEIKHGEDKVFLKRSQPQSALGKTVVVPMIDPTVSTVPVRPNGIQTSASEAPPSGTQSKEGLVEIKSPLIGTFYATPSPDSKPYVEVGSHVDAQTVVCIVEAMKVMNEIKAETNGTIAEVLVANGQAVEYGQVLFRVKPE
ncbi:MAG: acetyl-CoA carboxylase biotin carboxyl carrier protein [Phycisphaerae bacterium]|nr:acetyl-CoA carboxylase biotin carboxyl carrier protein [Phycisphaerae bacterium]